MSTVHWSMTKTGSVTSICYVQVTDGVPAVITEAEYTALTKVKCPDCETITKDRCLQLIGNTDAALIEEGCLTYVQTTTFSDLAGAVATQTQTPHKLFLAGVDVTATHEIVACPEPVVITGEVCIEAK